MGSARVAGSTAGLTRDTLPVNFLPGYASLFNGALFRADTIEAVGVPMIEPETTLLGQEIFRPPFREFQLQRVELGPGAEPVPLAQEGSKFAGQLPGPQQVRDRFEGLGGGEFGDRVAPVEQGVGLGIDLGDGGDVGDDPVQALADLTGLGGLVHD